MEVRGEFLIKHVIVCGDDFGMNADIDEAMISLAALGRMSAVSCLTLGPTFLANAARLAKLDIDLGLHLNLTEALSDGAQAMPSLSRLIMRAYAGRLDAAWVDAQLERQFDAFEAAFGRMPDYVDGHQHVHQLPVVRQRLLALLAPLRRAHALASADRAGHAQRHSTQGNVQGPCDRRAGRGRAGTGRRQGWPAHQPAHAGRLWIRGRQAALRGPAAELACQCLRRRPADVPPRQDSSGDCAMSRQRRAEYEVLACPKMGEWLRTNGVRIARLDAARH